MAPRGGGRRNNNRRAPTARAGANNSSSSDESHGSMPPLVPRGVQEDDSSSNYGDDGPPPLVGRGRQNNMSDSSDDDDDDSVPALIARNNHADDGDSTSTGSLPSLVPRAESPEESSEEDEDDDPPPLAHRNDHNSSDEESSGGSIPELLQGRGGVNDVSSSEEGDDSLPELVQRNNRNSDSSDDDSIPGLVNRDTAGYESEDSTFDGFLVNTGRWETWLKEGEDMKISNLKGNLKTMGTKINNFSGTEKPDLVLEFARLKAKSEKGKDFPGVTRKENPEKIRRVEELVRKMRTMKAKELRNKLREKFSISEPNKGRSELLQIYAECLITQEDQNAQEAGAPKLSEAATKLRNVQDRFTASRLRSLLQKMFVDTNDLESHEQLAQCYMYVLQQGGSSKIKVDSTKVVPEKIPPMVPAKDPSKAGAWVLSPADDRSKLELTYAWADGAVIQKSEIYATFSPKDTMMIPSADDLGSVWVYHQRENGVYCVDQFLGEINNFRIPMYENLPKASQLVTNGRQKGVWVLLSEDSDLGTSESSKQQSGSNLWLFDESNLDGVPVGSGDSRVPLASRLFMDVGNGGVWCWVPPSAAKLSTLAAGLWYIKVSGETTKALSDLPENSIVVSDSAREGVLLLVPGSGNTWKLMHAKSSASSGDIITREQQIDFEYENVQSMVDDGADGALVHLTKKSGASWKLARAVFGETTMVEKYNCPKKARIASTGQGEVWVLKKLGKGTSWGLQYLHENNTIEESAEKYAVNSILCGSASTGT